MTKSKVFISYSGKNRDLARNLYCYLNDNGADVFQFDESARPGDLAWRKILENINSSDYFIVLWSREAAESNSVIEEIEQAHYQRVNTKKPVMIPVVWTDAPQVDIHLQKVTSLFFINEESLKERLISLLGLDSKEDRVESSTTFKPEPKPIIKPDPKPIIKPETVLSASGKYEILSDGSLKSLKTGLIWEAYDDGKEYTWDKAMERAKNATTHGQTDWRLPKLDELKTLQEEQENQEDGLWADPVLKLNKYKTGWSRYWSSTLLASAFGEAWFVLFHNGSVFWSYRTLENYVRCVRSGK